MLNISLHFLSLKPPRLSRVAFGLEYSKQSDSKGGSKTATNDETTPKVTLRVSHNLHVEREELRHNFRVSGGQTDSICEVRTERGGVGSENTPAHKYLGHLQSENL